MEVFFIAFVSKLLRLVCTGFFLALSSRQHCEASEAEKEHIANSISPRKTGQVFVSAELSRKLELEAGGVKCRVSETRGVSFLERNSSNICRDGAYHKGGSGGSSSSSNYSGSLSILNVLKLLAPQAVAEIHSVAINYWSPFSAQIVNHSRGIGEGILHNEACACSLSLFSSYRMLNRHNHLQSFFIFTLDLGHTALQTEDSFSQRSVLCKLGDLHWGGMKHIVVNYIYNIHLHEWN